MYEILNLKNFIKEVRNISFEKFNESKNESDPFSPYLDKEKDSSSIDDIIKISEAKNIVMPLIKKKKNKYVITESNFSKIIQQIGARITSNLLQSLTSKGIIETAFDEEQNDFIFWIKK